LRRQVLVRQYIVDSASHRAKLVIEADGGLHAAEIDAARTAVIEADGYRVLRFWNNEILDNSEGVYEQLAAALEEKSPPPNQFRVGCAPGTTLNCRGQFNPKLPSRGRPL
jgi:very-short-patch-repair endonuclease